MKEQRHDQGKGKGDEKSKGTKEQKGDFNSNINKVDHPERLENKFIKVNTPYSTILKEVTKSCW